MPATTLISDVPCIGRLLHGGESQYACGVYSQILKDIDSALVELEQLAQEACRQHLATYYAIVAGAVSGRVPGTLCRLLTKMFR